MTVLDEQALEWCSRSPAQGDESAVSQRTVRGFGEISTDVREGELVGGKYRIGSILGAGAMGTVVAAQDITLGRKVAIKFLKPEAMGHEDAIARFFVEARSAAQLTSDHAVRVYEVARLDDGAPYIVMEYLVGCDLAEWIQKRGTIPVAQAVAFVLHACDAIAEAHDRGIIHRDVKPANLFAVDRGSGHPRIKVVDFGISKMAAIVGSTLPPELSGPTATPTKRSEIFGSFLYMSPEQMESAKDVDCRTDVWSLGVTLWELLSGQLPFRGPSLIGLHATIVSGARPRMRDTRRDVPAELEAILLRCLSSQREGRYATVRDLASALEPFGSQVGPGMNRADRRRGALFVRIVTSRWAPRISIGAVLLGGGAMAARRSVLAPPSSHAAAIDMQRSATAPKPQPQAAATSPVVATAPAPSHSPSPLPAFPTSTTKPAVTRPVTVHQTPKTASATAARPDAGDPSPSTSVAVPASTPVPPGSSKTVETAPSSSSDEDLFGPQK